MREQPSLQVAPDGTDQAKIGASSFCKERPFAEQNCGVLRTKTGLLRAVQRRAVLPT